MRDDALYQLLRTQPVPHRLASAIAVEPRLTDAELQVLRCLSHGMTVSMAADALSLSFETVRRRLRRIRYLLEAKTATHAVALAIRQGLIA